MNRYDILIISRHLRRAINQYEDALRRLEPGSDVYEITVSYREEAQNTLDRLNKQEP